VPWAKVVAVRPSASTLAVRWRKRREVGDVLFEFIVLSFKFSGFSDQFSGPIGLWRGTT
jgi:hypothetical protein